MMSKISEQKRTSFHKVYNKRKSDGVCVRCGFPKDDANRTLCKKCRKYLSFAMNKYNQRIKDEHRCMACHTPLPDGYYFIKCPECREKARQYREKANILEVNSLDRLTEFGYEELNNCYRKQIKDYWIIRVDKATKKLKYWNSASGEIHKAIPHIQDLIKAGLVR